MTHKITPSQKRFIEDFGNLYASYGFKRLNGLLIGLLLSSSEPLSLGEIAKLLNRSKGLISEVVRRLNSMGFIKKMEGSNSRKDYYTADESIFINVFHFNMSTVRKNVAIAEQFLHELENDKSEETKRWKRNLKVMDAFYQQMNSFYDGFDKSWLETRRKINF
jgi:DNA-binding transcriptional regulator GbsR (MarR family)